MSAVVFLHTTYFYFVGHCARIVEMAPSRSPKGKKTDGESVKEALARLKVATPEERAGEKASMATWTGTQCKTKLGAMGVDFTGVKSALP